MVKKRFFIRVCLAQRLITRMVSFCINNHSIVQLCTNKVVKDMNYYLHISSTGWHTDTVGDNLKDTLTSLTIGMQYDMHAYNTSIEIVSGDSCCLCDYS